MRVLVAATVFLVSAGAPGAQGPSSPAQRVCAPLGTSHTRTTLYFGLSRRTGKVSEKQWRDFMLREVTPRFADGLTVWEARGQWRRPDGQISRERAKVLLLVHDDSNAVHGRIQEIIGRYKRLFEQDSVLWETAPVCAAF